MFKYVLFLFLLYGIELGKGRPHNEVAEAREEITNDRIKKNGHVANGADAERKSENVLKNFRNPVLEYLMNGNNALLRRGDAERKGIIREIQHRQTLLIPNFVNSDVFKDVLVGTSAGFQGVGISETKRDPNKSSIENFLNYVQSQHGGEKKVDNLLRLQMANLEKQAGNEEDITRVQVYPAYAVLVNTFGKDGHLKNTVTHVEPNFDGIAKDEKAKSDGEVATQNKTINMEKNVNKVQKMHYSEFIDKLSGDSQSKWSIENQEKSNISVDGATHEQVNSLQTRQSGLTWPFANYFPIVINDPFLTAYNAITSTMYNTFSSVVEYGPEADICRRKLGEATRATTEQQTENVFDEVKLESDRLVKPYKVAETRRIRKRDTTGIWMETADGDAVNIKVEEPEMTSGISLNPDDVEERSRSHSIMLVNPPPLSTILRPPNTGYSDKRKKPTKPQKPDKEEGAEESSEEVGEEEEPTSSEGTSDGVAISPPPEGASVAEAKPVGLAIAGPGGVAAAKPQGTAVAGPGGLAIARPVGTAIAGVDVEGSIPIGAQQQQQLKNKNESNKKRPKQDPESDTDLQYVGGLTGPIGNPQPKQFDDSYFGGLKGTVGNSKPRYQHDDNMYFRARHQNGGGYQMKLGQYDGKYGFLPIMMTPVGGQDRLQKRMDSSNNSPTYFHGLLGTNNKDVPDKDRNSYYPAFMYY